MSKPQRNRKKPENESPVSTKNQQPATDNSRRKFLLLGLGGVGACAVAGAAAYNAGWFDPAPAATPAAPPAPSYKPLAPVTLTADAANASRAADELTAHFTQQLKNPSVMIHSVRAMGKNFAMEDGSKALEVLCTKHALEKELNGKRYIYFPREAEVHDNSFLKTMLEAGVSADQPIKVGTNQYTLKDLGESAKALFRCDPQNLERYEPKLVHQHLPWTLIAFSILTPPKQPTWVNAYGETINLPEVIDKSLAVYETTCDDLEDTIFKGEMESLEFRQDIAKYSCFGMHNLYGYLSCLQHGYQNNDLNKRLNKLVDSVIYRLQGDLLAIDREADAAKAMGPSVVNRLAVEGQNGKMLTQGNPPTNTLEVMRMRKQIQMLGHALESINYVRLHKIFTLTPEQQKRVQAGEQALYGYLVQLRATDLTPFMNWYPKFVSDIIIAVAHAARALKLLTPNNPDTVA